MSVLIIILSVAILPTLILILYCSKINFQVFRNISHGIFLPPIILVKYTQSFLTFMKYAIFVKCT